MIRFNAQTQVIISENLAQDIPALLQEEGAQHIAVVVDESVARNPDFVKLENSLKSQGQVLVHLVRAEEPTTAIVNEHADKLRNQGIDFLIGVGGGSVLDLTKALSVMVAHEGKVEDYHGTGKNFKAGVKKILIPSTAGTGSEVTPGAVLVNKSTKFKRAIGGKYVLANYAILYAPLTMTMPDSVTASTGLDALGHSIESYTAKCANDITRMYSKKAFSLIYNNLPKVLENPKDLRFRQQVLLGSCLAGFAIANSNTGAGHSMSYAFGIYHDVPHGVAVALLLPEIVKVNVAKDCDLYADLYDLIDNGSALRDRKGRAARFAELLEGYPPLKAINKKLRNYGVNEQNYEFLAARGLDLTPALNNNPVDFNLEDAKGVLKALI